MILSNYIVQLVKYHLICDECKKLRCEKVLRRYVKQRIIEIFIYAAFQLKRIVHCKLTSLF